MKKIKVPIFTEEYSVNVYIGTREEIIKEGAKECGDQPLGFGMQFSGRRGMACNLLQKSEPRYPLIILDGDLPADVALSTLAHEASHALDYIIEFIGLDDRSGEFKGHGIGAIMRAVTKLFLTPTKTDTLQKVKEDWDKQAEDAMNGLPTKTDKQVCQHEYGNMLYTSNPPQYRCTKCGEFICTTKDKQIEV